MSAADATPPVDLSDPATRVRLSPVATEVYARLCTVWNLTADERARLVPHADEQQLDQARLERISHLLQIAAALDVLFGTPLADQWMTLPNTGSTYNGRRPVDVLLAGGDAAFATIHAELAAGAGRAFLGGF